ncbi:dhm exonuclease [Nannochloropsis oceanica]
MDTPRRTRRRPPPTSGRCNDGSRPSLFLGVASFVLLSLFTCTHAFVRSSMPSLAAAGLRQGRQSLPSPFSTPSFHRDGVVVMGIPKLFRWLVDLYPSVQQRVSETLGTETAKVDNFYLDMNGIIHMCTHANAEELILLDERKMFQRIFTYTDRLYKIVAPTRAMFLAIDGVAPRAKMNQQRSRRFRSSKDQEALMAEMVAAGMEIMDDADRFDSNIITPGTDFMYRLGLAFRKWVDFKMETDPFWKNGARVVFSGPDVPGEGEHKIMDYIRNSRKNEDDWRPMMRHCMYGLDADLIMLSLLTHEPSFFLLREKMSTRKGDGYKDYYYQSKLGIGPGESEEAREARRAVARSYLEGLYWVLTYYHEGVRSWGWYFPYHYAPLASDLVDLPSINITFAKGRPYTPLMQLLNVLPSQSGPMLPEPYRDLMTQEDSPLRQFYPPDFETDRNGKQNSWESVVLIPFIDEDLMVSALAQVDHRAALSQEERARNILGKEHTFWPAKGRGPPIGKQLKGITAASRAGRKQHADRGVPQEIVEPDLDD